MEENLELNIDLSFIDPPDDPPEKVENHIITHKKRGRISHCEKDPSVRCLCRNEKTVMRRAYSESKLLDVLDHDLKPGHSYHCITGGDVDSLSYLKAILRQQSLDYVLFSTWCLADDDILQFEEWLKTGQIKRLDAYVGEIFPSTYRHEYAYLKQMLAENCPTARVCVFKNHSKIYAGTGQKFDFSVQTSANINTNPRTENGTITLGTDIYQFHKDYFDGIKSFNNDYPNWSPYTNKKKSPNP